MYSHILNIYTTIFFSHLSLFCIDASKLSLVYCSFRKKWIPYVLFGTDLSKNCKIKLFRAKKRFLELILNSFFFVFSSNEINF